MDNLNARLEDLAQKAKIHFGTAQGRIYLMRLWEEIYKSGKLYRPPREKISGNYEDIYDEAVFHLMEYILKNICSYDPTRGTVMAWVNMKLDRRFLREAIARFSKAEAQLRRPTLASLDGESNVTDLEELPMPEVPPLPSQLIKRCLEEDCNDQFKCEQMREYPHINFQAIALRHHVDGYSFKEIAEQVQIPYTSLVSFYQRRLKAFAPLIKQYCQNQCF
ncbi:hypothetical protein [Pantanalinema sp. GBBB05]|uniref:hypothetical protein n=1 Tax=Pantanalinema sp. GBBB05 TaxID=2604139 RepID=UPI001D625AF6|nr:hypothetical protein [Pantanalinema sp. GBBB05]